VVEELDVLIVGAGLSGIGAAVRLGQLCPQRRVTLFEGREALGGTWELFRYPGVRSDSDMFTLGFPFRPWREAKSIADGGSILRYLRETAEEHGVDQKIRFRHRVTAARWDEDLGRWTVDVEIAGVPRSVRCRFLYLCTGYYDYDRAHDPQIPGHFGGPIVHPQWWPADMDVTGKRVLVIGSGATAITLVPALAETAAHVTMVQRSPTWVAALPSGDAVADVLRKVLPERIAHRAVRAKNAARSVFYYQYCRTFPRSAARVLLQGAREHLPPGYPVEEHFTPRYAPWDQRLCLAPDGDLFRAITSGKASVVTAATECFTERGVRLATGEELEADVIVTATGLRVLPFGGMTLAVGGVDVDPAEALVYKGAMMSGVPNAAWCIGYTNASWTLRSDLTSQFVCRLLNHMDRRGYTRAMPRADVGDVPRRPVMDLDAGYLERAADRIPKQGDRSPWVIRQNYLLDLPEMRLGRVDGPDMRFA
jgi:monooxygenase